jgi:hypothetical protein
MTKSIRNLAAAIVLLVAPFLSQPGYAGLIDFRTSELNLVTTFSTTIESTGSLAGVTATFSNAMSETRISSSATSLNFFYLWHTGLALGSGAFGYSWDVVFDRTVSLTEWHLGFSSVGSFSISGAGVDYAGTFPETSSGGRPIEVELAQPLIFLADEVYNFQSPNRCCDGSDNYGGGIFRLWRFDEVHVPLPGSFALTSLALVVLLASVRRKHKYSPA